MYKSTLKFPNTGKKERKNSSHPIT